MPTTNEIKNDIEYVIFAQHEYPMERYTELVGIIDDLVKLVETHANSAVEVNTREVKYSVAKRLQETVFETVNDMSIMKQPYAQPKEPFVDQKPATALDELLMIDI